MSPKARTKALSLVAANPNVEGQLEKKGLYILAPGALGTPCLGSVATVIGIPSLVRSANF